MNVDLAPLHASVEWRLALARQDVRGVFRLLQRHGVPQRRIASACDMNQSEVSEILSGRQVRAYVVLERICAGVGAPREAMGLAYGPDAHDLLRAQAPAPTARRVAQEAAHLTATERFVLDEVVTVGEGLDDQLVALAGYAAALGPRSLARVRRLLAALWSGGPP